ncbi:hypothetical protein M1M25_gp073 [Tenacibaculum phage Gundel_1]|uniref:Uncharacterized protein n=1 Tax=Tenacibaculum phage Gundel_1 TaxID=2745672 RepID=A0A8E5EBL9_9CAUD|nr:hypothetical protein M1M25_gp073 [Tenacibaculum phage Gundel_1]QQV91509.1 hypothetical protein Gundel1_73 [Tenacibaculum phage Gundel_1]
MANGAAAAYKQLQPIKPIQTGAIIEEHIRYWKKYDDAKDAADKARKAKEAEALGKQKAEAFKLYSGLTPEENQGFLNSQIIGNFEKHKSEYAELAKKASRGDVDARLKLQNIKNKIDNITKANKVYGEKAVALAKQKAEGNYNEYIDKPIEDFGNATSKGMYKVNDDWSMDMYDPTSNEVKKVPSGALLSNEYLNASYNKAPQFQTNGPLIAKTLLDTADGQKLIDSDTKVKGTRLVKNLFAQDPTEAISWYGKYMKELGVDSYQQKPFSQLSDLEANIIAESYYNQNVLPRIQEVTKDTTLDDANKKAALINKQLEAKKKRLAIRKSNRKDTANIITVATNEKGDILKGLQAEYPTTAISPDSEIYIVGNNGVSLKDVKGDKETESTLTNLVIESNGDVVGLAKKVVKTPIRDSEGDLTGKFDEEIVDEVITNKNELNKFATIIEKDNGKKHKNLKQLVNTMAKARAEVAPKVETTREIVQPEQPTTRTTTQETKEARIARMRAAIKGDQ